MISNVELMPTDYDISTHFITSIATHLIYMLIHVFAQGKSIVLNIMRDKSTEFNVPTVSFKFFKHYFCD